MKNVSHCIVLMFAVHYPIVLPMSQERLGVLNTEVNPEKAYKSPW